MWCLIVSIPDIYPLSYFGMSSSSSLSLFPPYRDLQKNIHIIYKVSENKTIYKCIQKVIYHYTCKIGMKKILKDNYLQGI